MVLAENIILVERSFHENLMPSLREDVEHVTIYSSLPALVLSQGVPFEFARDSQSIQSACAEIVSAANQLEQSAHFLIAVAIKSNNNTGPAAKLDIIQIRTSNKIYILQVSRLSLGQLKILKWNL